MGSHKHISVTLDEETLKILDERTPLRREGKQRGDRSFLLRTLLRRYAEMCRLLNETMVKALDAEDLTELELSDLVEAYTNRGLCPETVSPIDFVSIDKTLSESIRAKIANMRFAARLNALVLTDRLECRLYQGTAGPS